MESFILGKLPFVVNNDEISLHVISSEIYVLRITDDRHVSLYSFSVKNSNSQSFQLIWENTAVVRDCALVSSDGTIFIKTDTNAFYLYTIKNNQVDQQSELSAHQFKDLLDLTEFSDCAITVLPVTLLQNILVLCINNQWLLVVEWLASKQPNVVSCIRLESIITSCVANKDHVYSMTVEGSLYVHRISDGILFQKIDIWNWLPWRESYNLFCVNEETISTVALLDPSNVVYLLDLSSAINEQSYLKFDDTQSVCSASSGVSYKTTSSYSSVSRTSSVAGSVIARQFTMKYSSADDLWLSYLEKLKKKHTHQGLTEKRLSNSTIKLDFRSTENLFVNKVNFTDLGVSVWFTSSGQSSGGHYRLYSIENGELIYSTQIPDNCCVIPFKALTVSLDLFFLKDCLQLPLFSAPKHIFINKMLQCINSRYIKMLLEGWEDMMNPSSLLQLAVCEGQLDTVHLALNLHSHFFRLEIIGEGLDGAHTKDILDTLMNVVSSPTATEQFIRQIRGLQLTHSYRLLGILDEENIPSCTQSEVVVIRNQIMESIVAARAGLEGSIEGSAPAPPEHSVEWVLWEGMSDMDVVRVGVARLSAVQCFLAVQRGWTPEELSGKKFKGVVIGSALHLLEKRDMEGAYRLISHAGLNAEEELKLICLNSLDKNLVDFIIESLLNIWNKIELQAWKFLTLISTVLKRYNQSRLMEDFTKNIQLSLTTVILISDEKRQKIITELYFRTWDTSLLLKLKREDCWTYLIETNCVEGLLVWLGMKQPPHQFPWPTDLFNQWTITQEMTDSVHNLNCTESTKEILFNSLALQGLFCTESKKNPQKIFKRLAATKTIVPTEDIVSGELCNNFLKFASDSNLVEFVVAVHKQLPSFLCLNTWRGQRHQVKWLDLWQPFSDVETTWCVKDILNIIERTVDFLATGSYDVFVRDHPLILIASTLIQNMSLSTITNDPPTVSPLLDIDTPGNKADDRRETTFYSLLSGTTAFHTDTLFQWQKDNRKNTPVESKALFPHFSCEKLSVQYGHKQCLGFIDHLKQGRPCFAFVQFFHEFSNAQGNIPTRMQKRGANVAHGLALQLLKDKDVGCSCVAFIEMLSRDSTPLRTHLACFDAVGEFQHEARSSELKNILQGVLLNKQESVESLMKVLQEALHPQFATLGGHNNVACLRMWQLPVMLANLHQMLLPESLLLFAAEKNNWLLFVSVICLFHYPKWQVMQLIKGFTAVALKEHFTYAFQLKVDNQGHINNLVGSPRLMKYSNSSEKLFACIAEYGNSAEQLLMQARAQCCSGFALLATCFQSTNLIACFCEWLAASIPKGYESLLPTNSVEWSSEHVSTLLEQVVALAYINTLHHGFLIFFPDNPLVLFTKFLVKTVEEKNFTESVLDIEAFKKSFSSLDNYVENFMYTKKWISETVIHLCSVALIKCFPAYSQQHLFLRTICDNRLNTELPVNVPDFQLLLSLTECLAKEGLTLDYTLICTDNQNFQLEKQLEKLIYSHKFEIVHSFSTIAGLPHGPILTVEWKEKAKLKPQIVCDNKFWESCDAAFIKGDLSSDDAILFYSEQADLCKSPQERYLLLKYALKWLKSKPLNDSTKYQELLLLYSMYMCFLQESFNIEIAIEESSFKPLKCFRKDLITTDTIEWFKRKSVKSLTSIQINKLDLLIGKLLEVGDLATVWCLEAVFHYKTKDSLILDGCLGLAEGEYSPSNLPQDVTQLLSDNSSLSKICYSPDSFSSSLSKMSLSTASSYSLLGDIEDTNTDENLEQKGTLQIVNSLVEIAIHSSRLGQYIYSALRIANRFGMQYKEVISMDNPLILIENGCDDLHLGKDIIILANLPADQTDFYLCSQIVKAVASSEKRFCGCAELSDVLFLAEDPLHLGKLLLAAASLTQRESFIQTAELLILAHNCFTRACNMEGISKVLKLCQKLTEVLLENCQWSLMVRLLTGIGRYTEMHYIFHLLKDNQQFESLLSKGLDKYTGLKSATLDFVRDDKELFTLVALHFLMYSELAAMFEENASSYLESLELNDEGKILHSDRNVQTLEAAVRAYMHAAQHYIQAKKLKRATAIINQAELVSLQWSFVTGVETGLNADCLLKLQCHQVTTFINNTLSYEEARIVSQAYNISIDWSAALYQQFIIKDNHQYLLAWLRHHELTYTIVQDVARRFQQEKTLSDSVVKNMKQFVQLIMQTDLKYRISSQMGFKDILQTLLSGPELPYLKDTVWLSGFKKQHI